MAEKVINEFKVIETDDGFRIEIKGDKEAIRQMLRGFGPSFFGGGAPHGHHFHEGFGPRFWNGFAEWCRPWEDSEEKKKAEK